MARAASNLKYELAGIFWMAKLSKLNSEGTDPSER